MCKRQHQSCTAAPDVVICRQEVQCPARLLHGPGHIAERLGAEGTCEGDRPRQGPELLLVRNHHPRLARRSRSRARADRAVKPLLGIRQPGRRGIHFTDAQQGEGVVRAEHRVARGPDRLVPL